MRWRISGVLAMAGLLVLAGSIGCSTPNYRSGFLTNYDELKPGPEGGVKERYIRPGVDYAKYVKVMIDPLQLFLAPDADYKGIDPEDMKQIQDMYMEEMIKALGTDYPVVNEPAPDVLRVRIAITNIKPNNPAVSTVSSVTPVGAGVNILSKLAGHGWTGVGDIGVEGEFLDSTTNQQLAAMVDFREGSKAAGFTKWGTAKEAFEFWAGRLKTFLDKVHGKEAKQ